MDFPLHRTYCTIVAELSPHPGISNYVNITVIRVVLEFLVEQSIEDRVSKGWPRSQKFIAGKWRSLVLKDTTTVNTSHIPEPHLLYPKKYFVPTFLGY